MGNQHEPVEILVECGLTRLQAKVYVALVFLETATAKDIHKCLDVARPDVYRMLSELDEKGLIGKIIGRPTKFRAIPPDAAISILLQRMKEKTSLLQEKATQAFKTIQHNSQETPYPDLKSRFIMLSKGETNLSSSLNKLRKAVVEAKTSVMGVVNFELFMHIKYVDEQSWKKIVKRKVKLRLITNRARHTPEVCLDPILTENDNFEIRWVDTPPPTSILVVDKKEAFFRVGFDLESPVLWSTDPCFVAMTKDYFETKWKSLKADRKKNDIA